MVLSLLPLTGAAAQETPPARGTDLACPGAPSSDFDDIAGSAHEAAVRCLADLGITQGLRGGERYGPRQDVERGQMASFIARFLELTTGEDLADGPDAFGDDDGSPHEDAIDALAAIGVVEGRRGGGFDPRAAVTRAQMASFIARALDHLDDGDLNGSYPPAGSDAFGDDDGSTHEDAIDAIAALGVVQGFTDGTYRPGDPVKRDQMASFLIRAYDAAIEDGLTPGPGEPVGDDEFAATIRRTAYGVPHVEAPDVGGLAYGMGYASAADTLCELMDRVMTANAERSRYLGPGTDNANIVSDLYHQRLIDDGTYDGLDLAPGTSPDSPSAEARDAVRGYAAGVSRYLADTPTSQLDSRCADQPWVQPFGAEEYWRVLVTYLSDQLQQAGQVFAAPPGEPRVMSSAQLDEPQVAEETGSNAYAFGSELTGGGGTLLANPHYPWDGSLRFYRAHLTIPGELNVVGAALINTPFVGIGHTDAVAWSHTVSTARRFGFFELTLDPDDPTAYLFDGEVVPMDQLDVTIQVNDGQGGTVPFEHTFYSTPFGNLLATPPSGGLAWTTERAYVFANTVENTRLVDQYLAMYRSADVEELFGALGDYQATAYNTTATDADGGTFFGDVGAIPHITTAQWQSCLSAEVGISHLFYSQRNPMLDGSQSRCQWRNDADAAVPGIFGPAATPHLFRDDYVTQSNDSHWLTNPEEPLEGLPRIFGDERTTRSLRTRLGLVQVEDRIDGSDGIGAAGDFGMEAVQEMLYGNRVYGAELVKDDLVAACRDAGSVDVDGETVDLTEACDVLDAWDDRVDVDSRGAHLFVRFVSNGGLVYAVPFDVDDPVHTPNTLATDDARVLQALGAAVQEIEAAGVDARRHVGVGAHRTARCRPHPDPRRARQRRDVQRDHAAWSVPAGARVDRRQLRRELGDDRRVHRRRAGQRGRPDVLAVAGPGIAVPRRPDPPVLAGGLGPAAVRPGRRPPRGGHDRDDRRRRLTDPDAIR